MAWERFENGSYPRKDPTVSILKSGMTINSAAVVEHRLENVNYVSLWYDKDTHRIGIKKESTSDGSVYKLCDAKGTRILRAGSFRRVYNLNKHIGRYPIEVIDGMLVITLNKEKEDDSE
jgi:hypothetical protein